MANGRAEPQKDASKSLGQRFRDHARGPKGFASIVGELKYALTDIRHKVVEEATYGRAVTPHWRDPVQAPQPGGGLPGAGATPARETGGVHGKTDAAKPDAGGGVHGKQEAPEKAVEAGVHGNRPPAEPKGLGVSYAELTASWEKACPPGQAAGREPPKQPEPAVER